MDEKEFNELQKEGHTFVESESANGEKSVSSKFIPSFMKNPDDRAPPKYKPWVNAHFERSILLHKEIIKMQEEFDTEIENDETRAKVNMSMQRKNGGISKFDSLQRNLSMEGSSTDVRSRLSLDGLPEGLDFVARNGVAPKVRAALAQDRTLESMYALVATKPRQERDVVAYHELMVWAVLYNRQELAEYFWQRGGLAIPSALVASVL
jgi:hypothetical protein